MFYLITWRAYDASIVPKTYLGRSKYAMALNSEEDLPKNVIGGKPGVWRGAYDPEFYATYMKSKENGLGKSLSKKLQSAKKPAVQPKKMVGGQAGVWMGAKDPQFLKQYLKLKQLEQQSLNQTQKNVTKKVIGGQPGVWQGAKDPKFLREYLIDKYSKKNLTKKHGTKKFCRKHQNKTCYKSIWEQLRKYNKTAAMTSKPTSQKDMEYFGLKQFPIFHPKFQGRRPGFFCKYPRKPCKFFGKKNPTKLLKPKVQHLVKEQLKKIQPKPVLENGFPTVYI